MGEKKTTHTLKRECRNFLVFVILIFLIEGPEIDPKLKNQNGIIIIQIMFYYLKRIYVFLSHSPIYFFKPTIVFGKRRLQ